MSSLLIWPNWNVRYAFDKVYGRAVDITNEVGIDRRTVKPIEGGIYSRELGSTIDTDKDVREYSCFCGELHSRLYEGDLCEICNTKCEEQFGADLDKYGWINLYPYFCINPGAYEMIKSVVGPKALERMLDYQINIDLEGDIVRQKDMKKTRSTSYYQNIGIMEFRKNFVEIMSYYMKTKPAKADRAKLLIQYKNRVFVDKIPIYSSLLRPAYASGKKKMFSYDRINSFYMSVINNTKVLLNGNSKRVKTIGIAPMLYAIQSSLQQAYHSTIVTKLSGKPKIIRSALLSTRTSFSSRAVITSLVGKHSGMDHTVIGYRIFLKLYTLEILNCMMRGIGDPGFKNMTIYELLQYLRTVKFAKEVDEKIYMIIEYLINNHKQGLWVIINRNPTMDLGSSQTFKIVHVLKDTKNDVIQVPLTSLSPYTGDFDGDVLNLWCLKTKRVAEAFTKALNPRYLILDPTGEDELFNNDYSIIKDQITAINSFNQPLRN